MKPRIELYTKKRSWLDTYISDDFCAGLLIGFCVFAGAFLIVMSALKYLE
jgi:hypothetical protein